MSGTWVVVPCYNEARRLPADRFVEHATRHAGRTFLFVDDGSTDATGQLLARTAARAPERLRFLTLERNRGKAEAVRRGVLLALEEGPRAVGYLDADLSTPLDALDDLEAILAEDPEVDLVLGARVKLLGREIERSAVRHYLGRVFATAVSVTLALPVYDTQCGAKLFRVGPGTRGLFRDPFLARWIFDVELLARMGTEPGDHLPLDRRIYEVPLKVWRHAAGSKIGPLDFLRAAIDLARIRLRYGPSRRWPVPIRTREEP
jgi:glycosyltransferase involved in cell wall biosynthesis